jgi:hypothetical protein
MMNDVESAEKFVVTSQQSGVVVAHLAPLATKESLWPKVRTQLTALVGESPLGLIVDCRALPEAAAKIVAPMLYELLVASRRRAPRIEVCAVGRLDQSIGEGSAFLLPPRYETIEEALNALTVGRPSPIPLKRLRNVVSDEPLQWDRPRPSFWHSFAGQIVLTCLVIGFAGGLVVFSARASFSKPVPMRRRGTAERDTRIVIQGAVQRFKGRRLIADPGAIVLAWPATKSATKFKLTAAQLFETSELPVLPSLVIVQSTDEGRYAIHFAQLPRPVASYHFLAISKDIFSDEPPKQPVLDALAEYFEDPQKLLSDRRHVVQELFVDVNVTRDQNFVFAESDASE